MRMWFRVPLLGCEFAPLLASKGERKLRIFPLQLPIGPAEVGACNALLDEAASASAAAVFVLPEVRTGADLAVALCAFRDDARWNFREVPWLEHPRHALLVGMRWTTSEALHSLAMGFAPFGTMPVTRRAPYAAFGLWPGGIANDFHPERKPTSKIVTFADMPHEMPKDAHDENWRKSKEWTRELLALPAEGAARPAVSFCLDADARPILFP